MKEFTVRARVECMCEFTVDARDWESALNKLRRMLKKADEFEVIAGKVSAADIDGPYNSFEGEGWSTGEGMNWEVEVYTEGNWQV